MAGIFSDEKREPNTQYILSYSYGKDSGACPEAILKLGLPLDRIITADVWATDTISADLPLMDEFKAKADQIILDRYGIKVEHICATREVERERERERERESYLRKGILPHSIFPKASERTNIRLPVHKGRLVQLSLKNGSHSPDAKIRWCHKYCTVFGNCRR